MEGRCVLYRRIRPFVASSAGAFSIVLELPAFSALAFGAAVFAFSVVFFAGGGGGAGGFAVCNVVFVRTSQGAHLLLFKLRTVSIARKTQAQR